jgi:hypothetical protein
VVLPLGAMVAACELTEVTVAPGKRVVVVQTVISRTDPLQFVVVEYSQTGEVPRGRDVSGPRLAPLRLPISGARVTIEHRGPGPCAGQVDTLAEGVPQGAIRGHRGVYVGPICPPQPGDLLALRVETPAGEVVTGTTTVPGAARRQTLAGAWAPATGYWIFNRQSDTLKVRLTPHSGVALQIEARNRADPNQLALFAFADTLDLDFPGNLVNPFQGDRGASVFRAGRYYTLGVALADRNYYDFVRSRSDAFTGRGFINHLDGGIGVFGSVETERYVLRVVAPQKDPREGGYRLSGSVGGVPVDVSLEVYLDQLEGSGFSAFVVGRWREGPIDTHGDGSFGVQGRGTNMVFQLQIPWPQDSLGRAVFYLLRGERNSSGAPFPMVVQSLIPDAAAPLKLDTLAAQQVSGPGLANGGGR